MPAVEGWFTLDERAPALLGSHVHELRELRLPDRDVLLPEPALPGTEFAETALSRTGTVWSYTDARYQPPAALRGRRPLRALLPGRGRAGGREDGGDGPGRRPASASTTSRVGDEVELVLDTLYEDDDHEYLVWKWRPTGGAEPDGDVERA